MQDQHQIKYNYMIMNFVKKHKLQSHIAIKGSLTNRGIFRIS